MSANGPVRGDGSGSVILSSEEKLSDPERAFCLWASLYPDDLADCYVKTIDPTADPERVEIPLAKLKKSQSVQGLIQTIKAGVSELRATAKDAVPIRIAAQISTEVAKAGAQSNFWREQARLFLFHFMRDIFIGEELRELREGVAKVARQKIAAKPADEKAIATLEGLLRQNGVNLDGTSVTPEKDLTRRQRLRNSLDAICFYLNASNAPRGWTLDLELLASALNDADYGIQSQLTKATGIARGRQKKSGAIWYLRGKLCFFVEALIDTKRPAGGLRDQDDAIQHVTLARFHKLSHLNISTKKLDKAIANWISVIDERTDMASVRHRCRLALGLPQTDAEYQNRVDHLLELLGDECAAVCIDKT